MDWLHVSVGLATGLVICAFAYFFEKVNSNQPDSLKRIAKAAGFLTVALLVSTSAAGYWKPVDLFGLAGILCFGIAWRLRLDLDFRRIALVFGVVFLAAWTYLYDMSVFAHYAGMGLALFSVLMMEITIWAWDSRPDNPGQAVATTN